MSYQTILYDSDGRIATITLNRPEALNTIVPPMPDEVEDAVNTAVRDQSVKVIVLRGAGRAFCAGYDFGGGFGYGDVFSTDGRWDPGKDMMHTTAAATSPHQKFMSIWRSPKPVIAAVHGWCVGGGSDYALCADLVIASEDAQIGTPYSRVWGAYLSGMWIYRLGLTRVKYHALTGKPLSGPGGRRYRPDKSGSAIRATRGSGRRTGRGLSGVADGAARCAETDNQSDLMG